MSGQTLGVILAGGRSSRMGGGDKALSLLGGQPVLAHVVARIRPQVGMLVINANAEPGRLAAFGLPVIADGTPGQPGPLAGLLAAMEYAARHRLRTDWLLSVPADSPFLPGDLVRRLLQARMETAADIVIARSGGRAHPVTALWSLALHRAIAEALARDERRLMTLVESRSHTFVDWPVQPRDPFFNINTPQDLAAAASLASGLEPSRGSDT